MGIHPAGHGQAVGGQHHQAAGALALLDGGNGQAVLTYMGAHRQVSDQVVQRVAAQATIGTFGLT